MFKNEARYLKEWIEYHRIQGVEKFYLYNNESTDEFLSILEPYIEKDIVSLTAWPTPNRSKNHVNVQKKAYNQALKKDDNQSVWMAFIDIDEFIVPTKATNLVSYLHQFDYNQEVGSIAINWQLYGTSNIEKLDKEALVTENFVMKGHRDCYFGKILSNKHIKSIVKPKACKSMTIHYPNLLPGYREYPGDQVQKSMSRPVNVEQIRVNHYWTRDEDFFINTKIARKQSVFRDSTDSIIEIATKLNMEKDTSIFRFIPALKQRMVASEIYP